MKKKVINIEKHKGCWIAKETSKGWKIGLSVGHYDRWFRPSVYFQDAKQIEKLLKLNIVFVEMRK